MKSHQFTAGTRTVRPDNYHRILPYLHARAARANLAKSSWCKSINHLVIVISKCVGIATSRANRYNPITLVIDFPLQRIGVLAENGRYCGGRPLTAEPRPCKACKRHASIAPRIGAPESLRSFTTKFAGFGSNAKVQWTFNI